MTSFILANLNDLPAVLGQPQTITAGGTLNLNTQLALVNVASPTLTLNAGPFVLPVFSVTIIDITGSNSQLITINPPPGGSINGSSNPVYIDEANGAKTLVTATGLAWYVM